MDRHVVEGVTSLKLPMLHPTVGWGRVDQLPRRSKDKVEVF